ncbi:hypothetical protein OSTOST_18648, partial [Ostertagia ostertagi]
ARQERERQELQRYQAELKELKRVKVDLMKKIKEEMKKAQQQQSSASKKLAALDKEASRLSTLDFIHFPDVAIISIRQLENKDRQREQFMKRTTEEINRLRKAQKEQAKQTRLATTPKMTPVRPTPYRPISRLVTQKQTVGKMEEELGRLLEERARLTEEIKNL